MNSVTKNLAIVNGNESRDQLIQRLEADFPSLHIRALVSEMPQPFRNADIVMRVTAAYQEQRRRRTRWSQITRSISRMLTQRSTQRLAHESSSPK